jgi:type IV pilus assembly protein PilB
MSSPEDRNPGGSDPSGLCFTESEKRIGRFLLEKNILTPAQIKQAVDFSRERGLSIQGALFQLNLLTLDVILKLTSATRSDTAGRDSESSAAPPGQGLEEGIAKLPLDQEALAREQADHAPAVEKKDQKKMVPKRRPLLGEILVEQGLVTPDKVELGLAHAKKTRTRLGEALVALGLIKEADVAVALSRQFCLPIANLARNPPDPILLAKIPARLCEKHQAIPLRLEGKVLSVAMVDPLNIIAMDDFQNLTGWTVQPVLVTRSDLEVALTVNFSRPDQIAVVEKPEKGSVAEASAALVVDDGPIVSVINKVILTAFKKGASDIHIDPHEDEVSFRMRIDGVLQDMKYRCPKIAHAPIVSRIKVMCNLDIAETRLPQDGKFRLQVEDKKIDFRVSVIPVTWGEKIVIRLLDQSKSLCTVEGLGLETLAEKTFRGAVTCAHGITLITGPTGSGKSTTLYAAILAIQSPKVNIHTIEDPIEFTLMGVSQVAVK